MRRFSADRGSYDTPGEAMDVVVLGDFVNVADDIGCILVLLSKEAPQIVPTTKTPPFAVPPTEIPPTTEEEFILLPIGTG